MKKLTDYQINTQQPEEMSVQTLNELVKELRERLYQQRIKNQQLEEELIHEIHYQFIKRPNEN